MNSQTLIRTTLSQAKSSVERLLDDQESLKNIETVATLMADALRRKKKIITCGNGGSHCDAMHFAEELTGRYREDRPALAGLCISDPSHISCTGNDMGFDQIFSRFVDAHGLEGDVLLGISTSGKSKNVLRAFESAKKSKVTTVLLTGRPGSELASMADVTVCTQAGSSYADRVQELHIKVIHIWIDLIEKKLGYSEW